MKQNNNVVMTGASGALGNQLVFRQMAGKTVISLPPVHSGAAPTANQQEIRDKFAAACRYARMAIANPELKAAYQAKSATGTNAYNTAIADYFKPPVIVSVDASSYTGSPGGSIGIHATDDFRVQLVYVTIQAADGSIIEQGPAAALAGAIDLWTYATTAANAAVAGTKIVVQASDQPGNIATHEIVL